MDAGAEELVAMFLLDLSRLSDFDHLGELIIEVLALP